MIRNRRSYAGSSVKLSHSWALSIGSGPWISAIALRSTALALGCSTPTCAVMRFLPSNIKRRSARRVGYVSLEADLQHGSCVVVAFSPFVDRSRAEARGQPCSDRFIRLPSALRAACINGIDQV